MNRRFLSLWIKRISFTLLSVVLFYSITLGVVTKKNFDRFLHNIESSAPTNVTSRSALALSDNVGQIFTISRIPVIHQLLHIAHLDFESIQDEIQVIIHSAPILSGADSPKRYMVAFQNSAEARGTGGILGAFAIVELNRGSFSVLRTGSNAALYSLKDIPVKVPTEFTRLYGKNPAILQNSNLSPHFPYGAEIWMGLWKKQFGEQLDGVIAIDPSALSYVLESTGPITLKSGEVISSENVVSETLQKAYKRYENDNNARKQYLVDILNAAAAKITSGQYSKIGMVKAIMRGLIENRILMYSRDKSAQKELSSVRLGGFMSSSPNNEFRVVVQNIDAGKLDYYLQKSVTIESTSCKVPIQNQVKVKVTNTLKSAKGLPPYVLTRADKDKPKDVVPGQHRFKLFIYGPTNSKLISVSRENRRSGLGGSSTERGRPIYVADVDLKPGESENLLANFAGGVGKVTFIDQPLVRPTQLNIKGGC